MVFYGLKKPPRYVRMSRFFVVVCLFACFRLWHDVRTEHKVKQRSESVKFKYAQSR